jgi:hypothetical protein
MAARETCRRGNIVAMDEFRLLGFDDCADALGERVDASRGGDEGGFLEGPGVNLREVEDDDDDVSPIEVFTTPLRDVSFNSVLLRSLLSARDEESI